MAVRNESGTGAKPSSAAWVSAPSVTRSAGAPVATAADAAVRTAPTSPAGASTTTGADSSSATDVASAARASSPVTTDAGAPALGVALTGSGVGEAATVADEGADAGADVFVAGSAVYGSEDAAAVVDELRTLAARAAG